MAQATKVLQAVKVEVERWKYNAEQQDFKHSQVGRRPGGGGADSKHSQVIVGEGQGARGIGGAGQNAHGIGGWECRAHVEVVGGGRAVVGGWVHAAFHSQGRGGGVF